jgi:hypothetical protein
MKKIINILLLLTLISCNSEYKIENDNVYFRFWSFGQGGWNEWQIKNADVKSFIKIESESNLYGKDKNNVYYKNLIIHGADPKTFKYIKKGFSVDKNKAFYNKDSIEKSSSKQFKVIDSYFSKDFKNVYYKTKPLNVCSVKNFNFVHKDIKHNWSRWSTDGCFYYVNEIKVPSNDYENIVVFKESNGFSKDSKYVYYKNKKITYPKEFAKLLDTIDIKTLEYLGNNNFKDKYGCIIINNELDFKRILCEK